MKTQLFTLVCVTAAASYAEDVNLNRPNPAIPADRNARIDEPDSPNLRGVVRVKKIELTDLPGPVVQRVKTYPHQVADIDKENWNGKTIYEIEFSNPGKNKQIHVAEDGTLVRDDRKDKEKAGVGVLGFYMGTQLSDLPAPAQQTVRQAAGSAKILDIDKEIRTGPAVYQVEFEENGVKREIRVAADGRLVNEAAGADIPRRSEAAAVNLDGKADPDISSLPAPVQNAVRATDQGRVVDVDIKDDNGRKIYEVDFQRDGINRRVEFGADGTVLKDNKK